MLTSAFPHDLEIPYFDGRDKLLTYYVGRDDLPAVEMLLKAGCDVNARQAGGKGDTPLLIACT